MANTKPDEKKHVDKLKDYFWNFTDFLTNNRVIVISVILSIVLFIWIYDIYILNPCYTDWLLVGGGDLTTHYIGWKAYRESAWHFQIGLTDNLSYPNYSSIIFTDSIPLFAIIFKMLSPILPDSFQYFGIWGLFSFILQGGISAIILKKYISSNLSCILGSTFFTASSIVLHRMFGHTALGGNWVILLSILMIIYYDKIVSLKKKIIYWSIIGLISSSVHIYFLAINGIFLLGYAALEYKKNKKIYNSIIITFAFLASSIIMIFLLGGFSIGGIRGGGFGHYSFNYNSLFNPMKYSRIFKDLKSMPGQYEGFCYLGAGIILMLIITIAFIINSKISKNKQRDKKDKKLYINILIICSIIFMIFSASQKAYLGETLVYDIPIPDFLLNLFNIFRSSGRFIWPVFYLIVIFALCGDNKYVNKKGKTIIILFCVLLQFYDFGDIIKGKKKANDIKYNSSIEEPLKTNFRKLIQNNSIKHLEIMFDMSKGKDKSKYIFDIADFATDNNLTIDKFLFSRSAYDYSYSDNIEKKDDTFYIFLKEDDYKKFKDMYFYDIGPYIICYSKELYLN